MVRRPPRPSSDSVHRRPRNAEHVTRRWTGYVERAQSVERADYRADAAERFPNVQAAACAASSIGAATPHGIDVANHITSSIYILPTVLRCTAECSTRSRQIRHASVISILTVTYYRTARLLLN